MNRCEGNAAPYALGALPPAERAEFERHVADCAICREELSSLQEAAATLPAAVPQMRAPREVRKRVLAEVRAESRGKAQSRRPRPALVVAVLAAAALVVGGLLVRGEGGSVRRLSAQVRPSGAAVVLQIGHGRTVISLSRMPAPGAGRVYEVWTKRGGAAPRPTDALFGVTHGGSATTAIAGEANGASEILITSEPTGGSSTPTRAPVVVARL